MIREELIEEGIVVKTENGLAEIELVESELCHTCGARLFCKPGANDSKHLKVYDPYDSHPGDKVKISVPGRSILKASLLLYGIPLLTLVIGIVIGNFIFAESLLPELFSFLLGIAFTGLYYVLLYLSGKKRMAKLDLAKIITITRNSILI